MFWYLDSILKFADKQVDDLENKVGLGKMYMMSLKKL